MLDLDVSDDQGIIVHKKITFFYSSVQQLLELIPKIMLEYRSHIVDIKSCFVKQQTQLRNIYTTKLESHLLSIKAHMYSNYK